MSRRCWFFPLVIGILLLVVICYWGHKQYNIRQQLEIELTNRYYHAFYNLIKNIQNVEVLLSKLLVAQAPEKDIEIIMELRQQASEAQSNLNQLPLPDITMVHTSKFFTRVSDYAHSLSTMISSGKEKSTSEWETLKRLYKQSSALNIEFQNIERKIASGNLRLSELTQKTKSIFQKEESKLAKAGFKVIEDYTKNLPTFIYDGPFSEHLEKSYPKGLTGEKISFDQARKKVLGFINRRYPQGKYVVERITINKGEIKAYNVDISSCLPRLNERITAAISEKGGHVLWYVNSRNISNAKVSLDEARKKARQFLFRRGYNNLLAIYYEQGNGIAIFNFAPLQDGVILYPDQIKVTVALDNGQITGFEAMQYLINHHRRNLPLPCLTASQARLKLSPHLKNITGGHLVLIPTETKKEILTYEFRGELDNDTFLIYINALNGKEEQVLRLIRNKEGILTL